MLSVFVGCVVNISREKGLPFVGEWENDTIPGYIIDTKTAYTIWKEQKAVFVDARSKQSFEIDHIPGAMNLPRLHLEEYIAGFFSSVDTDRLLVVYCSSEDCSDSKDVARYLKWRNYKRICVFKGGIMAWEEHGYPLEE